MVNGPAPVQLGDETRATLDTGTVLTAGEVRGKWVAVTAKKGDSTIDGWVNWEKHLRPAKAQVAAGVPRKVSQVKVIDKNVATESGISIRPPTVVRDAELSGANFGDVRTYHGGTVLMRIEEECGLSVYLHVQGGTLYAGNIRIGDRIEVAFQLPWKVKDHEVTEGEKKTASDKLLVKLKEQPAYLTDADGKQVGKSTSTLSADSGIANIKWPARFVTPWGTIDLVLPEAAK